MSSHLSSYLSSRLISTCMASASSSRTDEGVRFVYEPPSRQIRFNFGNRGARSGSPSPSPMAPPTDVVPEVEMLVEEGLGAPTGFNATELKRMQIQLRDEAGEVMRLALLSKAKRDPRSDNYNSKTPHL
jgi:hypothetical protein